MTKNIFDAEANRSLLNRLANVHEETKPLWGIMNASQMVTHCQKPLDVATGKLTLKHTLIGLLFGRMAKNDFLRRDSFKRNLPTAPQFKIKDTPDFKVEKDILKKLISDFGDKGPSIILNKTHPFFGKMNDEEWGILQYKHLDHHLTQFGT